MKNMLIYYFLILFLFKETVGKCDVYEQILNGTSNFVTQLWKNLTNSDCQKKCKANDVPQEASTSEESIESTEERYNQKHSIECIPRVNVSKDFEDKKSWRTYLSQWQYDHSGMLLWDRFFGTFECGKKKKERLKYKVQEKIHQEEVERQNQQQILWQQQEAQRQKTLQQQQQEAQRQKTLQQQQQEIQRQQITQQQSESERLRLQQQQIDFIRQKQWNELNRLSIVSNIHYDENDERLAKIMNFQQQQMLFQIEEQRKLNESLGIMCITQVKPPDRYEENAWHEYLYNWQYDYCMIASI